VNDGTDWVLLNPITVRFGVPQYFYSVDHTLTLNEANHHILHPASDANVRTFTIPANASVPFRVGTAITFVNASTADLNIAITSDTLALAGTNSSGSVILTQNGMATALKIDAVSWIISGTGLA
jgi:hypothetical protein